ncbi:MAG: YjbQ family protein [Spirochaetales bacterium]|nr:YjbQ family protein [Spirochaetales bacterium]
MSFTSLSVRTSTHSEMVNVTSEVAGVIHKSGMQSGICIVYVPHTTCGVTINEAADPDVKRDMLMELNKIVPLDDGYRHFEGNSAAHIKSSLMGFSTSIPVVDGKMTLGTWQGIYLCEFDGPRSRKIHIQLVNNA